MNLKEKGNLTRVSLLIDTGFLRFLQVLQFSVENFNGFMMLYIFTKFFILDVWQLQNSHLTLINEKSFKLALNIQLVFTCSKSGIETLEQVLKYIQSLYCYRFNTLFRCLHCWLRTSKCCLGRLNCRTECISKLNSSNA